MSVQKKVKTALDETRLLILGAQVLFGFQFNSVFQEGFRELPEHSKALNALALFLMMLSIACLVAPAMRHRIVEQGEATKETLSTTTVLASLALLPFAIALGLDLFTVIAKVYGTMIGSAVGGAIFALSMFAWFILEFALRSLYREHRMPTKPDEAPTPLPAKIEQLLTEARLVLPGAQALLGFQFTAILTHAFTELPPAAKLTHVVALCCVALGTVLLMTPAALHRITFGGEDSPAFFRMASAVVIVAPIPLALGIAADIDVAVGRALESPSLGRAIGLTTIVILAALWYGWPLWQRKSRPASVS
jgi:hypothetical protein